LKNLLARCRDSLNESYYLLFNTFNTVGEIILYSSHQIVDHEKTLSRVHFQVSRIDSGHAFSTTWHLHPGNAQANRFYKINSKKASAGMASQAVTLAACPQTPYQIIFMRNFIPVGV
jgi:hypothetical protein